MKRNANLDIVITPKPRGANKLTVDQADFNRFMDELDLDALPPDEDTDDDDKTEQQKKKKR